jgi:NADPH:quinone reductase-like Zn-dependent oxidoreductase
MLAAAIDRFGGRNELMVRTLPVPGIGTGEVLIALDTSGVGPWDAKIREGWYQIREGWYPGRRPRFPLVLGVDGAASSRRQVRGFVDSASATRSTLIKLEQGADEAVDGRHGDIVSEARRFAPQRVDAVLAFAGGDGLEAALEALHPGGRLAFPNGVEPLPKKRRGIKFIPFDAVSGVREFRKLNLAVEAAKLKVPIAETYPLTDAAKAHQRLAEGRVPGKIVLRIRQL